MNAHFRDTSVSKSSTALTIGADFK